MRLKSLLAFGSLSLGLCSHGWCGYYAGYTDWQYLSPVAKGSYVAGALDYLTQFFFNDPFHSALSQSVTQCLLANKLTTVDLANDVDRLYGDYLELRKVGSAVVVYLATVHRCQE